MISTLQFLLSLFLVFSVFFFAKVRRAKKIKESFVKHAKSLGYKVHDYPFNLFGFTMYTEYKKQEKKHGDAYYHYKYDLPKYDIVVSNLLFTTMVEILNPQLCKQFYAKANDGFYDKGQFAVGHMKSLLGAESLLLSNGDVWKQKRKIVSSVFNYNFIVSQISKMEEICDQAIRNMEQQHTDPDNTNQVKLDITQLLNEVFSNIILKCFFKSHQLNYIKQEKTVNFINRLMREIVEAGRSKMGILFGNKIAKWRLTSESRKINDQIMQFRKIATKIVEERIKQIAGSKNEVSTQENPEDIIDALLKQNQNLNLTQLGRQPINPESIVNQFVTFFIAGTETTIAFTRMMIYRLASSPEIMQRVRQEIDREITSSISLSELKNLKYVERVQKEVLRMDSSVGAIITRLTKKDHYLNQLRIPKGTAVNVRIRGIHYKQSEFSNPHQFNPDRWTQQSKNNTYSFLPFSAGSRNCIGQHLALLENKILIVKLLKNYEKVSIQKRFEDIKMLLRSMYGPEKLVTTLTKYKK